MEIKIKRTKEFKKGGFLSDYDWRLALEISVFLSEDEKELVKKYYDPWISLSKDIPQYFKSREAFDVVEDFRGETSLSEFKVSAHVDGDKYLGNIEILEKAIITELTDRLDHLKSLDRWEGEEVITI